MKATLFRIGLVVAALLLTACGGTTGVNAPPEQQQVNPYATPAPGHEAWAAPNAVAPGKDGAYVGGIGANQDLHIYDLTGVVQGVPGQIQNYSSSSSITAVNGYASGYSEAGTSGKGIVKFLITEVKVTNPYEKHGFPDRGYEPRAAAGEVRAIKAVDSSAQVLAAGETVTFRCRIDQDFMEPVADQEQPSVEGLTWEFDFCRVISPITGGVVITGTAPISSTGVLSGTGR